MVRMLQAIDAADFDHRQVHENLGTRVACSQFAAFVPSAVWTAAAPIWLAVSLLRVSAYAFDRTRFATSLPSPRAASLQSLLLFPLAILGCSLMLRSWRHGGRLTPAAAAAPVMLALLAWPAFGLASWMLSSTGDLSSWALAVEKNSIEFWYPWLSDGIDYLLRYAISAAVMMGVIAHRREAAERACRVRAEELAVRERQRALRAQISPHFLFNALNSLVGLNTASAARREPDLLTELSHLLRLTTLASEREEHTLAKELEYVATYLKIQGIRHPRLRTQMSTEDGCDAIVMPTLIVMSLVENAVSHGLRGMPTAHIEVRSACTAAEVVIVVRNTVPVFPVSDAFLHQGTGLRMTRERLALLFGTTASLRTGRPDATHFEAILRLPLRRYVSLGQEPRGIDLETSHC